MMKSKNDVKWNEEIEEWCQIEMKNRRMMSNDMKNRRMMSNEKRISWTTELIYSLVLQKWKYFPNRRN